MITKSKLYSIQKHHIEIIQAQTLCYNFHAIVSKHIKNKTQHTVHPWLDKVLSKDGALSFVTIGCLCAHQISSSTVPTFN